MIYECDQCSTILSPGMTACPKCGEKFDAVVPMDAEVPKSGFTAKTSSASPVLQAKSFDAEHKPAQDLPLAVQLFEPKQVVGLFGSLILFFGTFAPIVSLPVVGSQNYFQNGKGDGTILIGFALVSALLAVLKKYEGLWLTGALSLGVLAFTFLNLQARITGMEASMKISLADNPFGALGEVMLQSVQLQWGWAILVIGALLLIVAAAMRLGRTSERGFIMPLVSGALLLLLVSGSFAYTQHEQEQTALELKAKSDQQTQEKISRQNAEQIEQQATQDAVNKLNLLEWHWDDSNQFSRYLVGSVKNDSDRSITFISIDFDLLDNQGNKVGSADDLVNSLSPGETWKFRAMAGPETASTAQLSSLKGTVEPNTGNTSPPIQPVTPAPTSRKSADDKPAADLGADPIIKEVPRLEKRLRAIGYINRYFTKVTLGDDEGVVDVISTRQFKSLSASKQNAIKSATEVEWHKIYSGPTAGIVEVMDYPPGEMTDP